MKKFLMFILCLSVFPAVFPVMAAEDAKTPFTRENIKYLSVVAPLWEDYTNADGTGLYWEVLKDIYEPENIRVKTSNVPWNRAMKMVTKYQVYSAIVGEYLDTEEDLIFPEYAIDVEYMSVLTLSGGQMSWTDLSSLSGHNVGWIKDYEVIPAAERNFNLVEYRTTAQGLELLDSGKIDYLIDEWDEIAAAVAETNGDMTRYVMNDMPDGTDVYVGFPNTALSQVLIDIYNDRIEQLYRQKKLQPLYEKWESEVPESVSSALNQDTSE